MFKKPIKIGAQNQLSGKDRKTIKSKMSQSFDEKAVETMFAKNEKIICAKTTGSKLLIYTGDQYPLFIDGTGKQDFFPTVYTCQAFGPFIKYLHLNEGVENYIYNGANLMWPGVSNYEQLGQFTKDQVIGIKTAKGEVIAIGALGCSLAEFKKSEDKSGVAAYILHYKTDKLYDLGPKLPVQIIMDHETGNKQQFKEQEKPQQEPRAKKEQAKKEQTTKQQAKNAQKVQSVNKKEDSKKKKQPSPEKKQSEDQNDDDDDEVDIMNLLHSKDQGGTNRAPVPQVQVVQTKKKGQTKSNFDDDFDDDKGKKGKKKGAAKKKNPKKMDSESEEQPQSQPQKKEAPKKKQKQSSDDEQEIVQKQSTKKQKKGKKKQKQSSDEEQEIVQKQPAKKQKKGKKKQKQSSDEEQEVAQKQSSKKQKKGKKKQKQSSDDEQEMTQKQSTKKQKKGKKKQGKQKQKKEKPESEEQESASEKGQQKQEESNEVSAISSKLMDNYMRQCFLNALKLSRVQDQLPVDSGRFYMDYMLLARPDGVKLDVKQSSFKKLGKFYDEMAKQKFIQFKHGKEKKGQQGSTITKIFLDNDELKNYQPTILRMGQKEVEVKEEMGNLKAAKLKLTKTLTVNNVYTPSDKLMEVLFNKKVDHLKDIDEDQPKKKQKKNEYFTEAQLRDKMNKYIDDISENKKKTEKHIIVDYKKHGFISELMSKEIQQYEENLAQEEISKPAENSDQEGENKGKKDKKKNNTFRIDRQILINKMMKRTTAYHHIADKENDVESFKEGQFKGIQLFAEKTNNKNVTRIVGLEIFITPKQEIDRQINSLSQMFQQKFACSVNVLNLPGKHAGKEMILHGTFIDQLEEFFTMEHGVKKDFITTVNKLDKKKKNR